MEKCKLCGKYSKLIDGHIVPKFVIDYIKKTSVTGYLREGKNIKIRRQDIKRLRLLCNDCEQLFSKREKLFSENIFKRFHDEEMRRFSYEDWLRYFIISLCWRISIDKVEGFEKTHPALGNFVRQAIDNWTPYLLEKTKNPGDYQYNMFMTDIISISDSSIGAIRLNWYLLRTCDATIVFSKKEVEICCRIPGFLFFSHVNKFIATPQGVDPVGRF